MKSFGRLLMGLMAAAGSGILVLAAASLALVEGGMAISAVPAPVLPTTSPTSILSITRSPAPTGQGVTPTNTITASPTQVETPRCAPPPGWQPYIVQPGDSLEALAASTGTSIEVLEKGNCMFSAALMPNTTLYLPVLPPTSTVPPTDTPQPTQPPVCVVSPRPGWTIYVVQSGDTLYRLSQETGTTVNELMAVNCLPGTNILRGQRLFLPYIPVRVPTNTRTPTPEPTQENTITPVPTKSGTNTVIPTVNATETAAANATATSIAETATANAEATSVSATAAANATASSIAETATANANATATSISLTATAAAAKPPEPPPAPANLTPVTTPAPVLTTP